MQSNSTSKTFEEEKSFNIENCYGQLNTVCHPDGKITITRSHSSSSNSDIYYDWTSIQESIYSGTYTIKYDNHNFIGLEIKLTSKSYFNKYTDYMNPEKSKLNSKDNVKIDIHLELMYIKETNILKFCNKNSEVTQNLLSDQNLFQKSLKFQLLLLENKK